MTQRLDVLAHLYDPVFARNGPDSWDHPIVSYHELVKGGRLLSAYPPGCWQALGISRQGVYRAQSLMMYFAALVYKADQMYEEAQRNGTADVPVAAVKGELERLFRGHGLYDDKIAEGLDDLERYGALESRIVLGQVRLTPAVLRTAFELRSSDVVLLVRVLAGLSGVDCTGLLRLLRPWLVLWEIGDDLASYRKDVSSGSFNALDLHVRLHGPEQAATRLDEFQTETLIELFNRMDQASAADLRRLTVFTSERVATGPALTRLVDVLPRALLVPFAKRVQVWEGKRTPEIPDVRRRT